MSPIDLGFAQESTANIYAYLWHAKAIASYRGLDCRLRLSVYLSPTRGRPLRIDLACWRPNFTPQSRNGWLFSRMTEAKAPIEGKR